jgi:nucleotide-binding universal stress UspA family protein
MYRARVIALSFALLAAWNLAGAQVRVALLPFNNAAAVESAREVVEEYSRRYMERRGIETVDADSVSGVLRSLRIRNTATPAQADLRALADSLDVSLVLLGTIHRFTLDSTFSEATICARLFDVEKAQMVWNDCAVTAGGGERALVSTPVHRRADKLAKSTVKRLFSSLNTDLTEQRYRIDELVVSHHKNKQRVACTTVAVIPPVDEAEGSSGGDMIGDFLVMSLARRGFNVVDPGRVRDVMLQCEDLRHGQSVNAVSTALAESLGVDLVVTGTVSDLTTARHVSLGSNPEAAFELRMIDPSNNVVMWAKHFRRTGKSGSALFGVGAIHSPARLVRSMVDSAVSDLRVVRRKNIITSE